MERRTISFLWQKCAVIAFLLLLASCTSKADRAAAQIEIGQKYLMEMNYTEAVVAFTEVIELDPKNIEAYMGRAEAYVNLEQYEDAKGDYTQVIAIDAQRGAAYTGRGDVYVEQQDYTNAIFDYDEADSLGEDVAARIEYAVEKGVAKEQEQGGIEAALAWLEKIGRTMLDLYKKLTNQAITLEKLRDEVAAGNYETVLEELGAEENQIVFAEITEGTGKACLLDAESGKSTILFAVGHGYKLYYGGQKNDRHDGAGVEFHCGDGENTTITEATWTDGILDGPCKKTEIGDSAKWIFEETLVNGIPDGATTMTFIPVSGNAIVTTGTYKNGQEVGIWKSVSSDGSVFEMDYDD